MGQTTVDTVVSIPPIVVQETRLRNAPAGTQNQLWEKTDPLSIATNSLGELLASHGEAFIKSYGQGSLATISLRGGSSSQTLLLWQGLPVASPMLGLVDLSLIPSTFDEISLQKGGNSIAFGSGAIAGILSLTNTPNFNERTTITSQSLAGSFGHFTQNITLELGNEHFSSSTKLNYETAKNNFRFRPFVQSELIRQSHNRFHKNNLMQDLSWRINAQNKISLHYWFQNADRQIPPTLTQIRSEARQKDSAHRLSLIWSHTKSKSVWRTKLAVFDESQNFDDKAIGLSAENKFTNLLLDVQSTWSIASKQYLLFGFTSNYTTALADAYTERTNEIRSSVFGSYRYTSKLLTIQGGLRQQVVDGLHIPLIPSLGLEWNLIKSIRLNANISRNFRLPTLNDRYWRPGGNRHLQPESGWSQELGLQFSTRQGNKTLRYAITGFNRIIKQWILWRPEPNQAFWAPENIGKVWSRGLENRLNYKLLWNHLSLNFKLGHDLIYSTNEVPLQNPKIEKRSQLIYTPRHQLFAKASLSRKQFLIYYRHAFIGKTSGINDAIDPYDLGTLGLQHKNTGKKIHQHFFLQINNIWNRQYLIIERRPMPRTNWTAGVRIQWQRAGSRGQRAEGMGHRAWGIGHRA